MNFENIQEFRTNWNNEFFNKNKSAIRTAKYLIKKSIIIDQIRAYRQLKYIENNLVKELKTVENERKLFQNSLVDNLQERLKILQNQIDNYNKQINNLVQQEKQYWKQLEQTIARRTNLHKSTMNKLSTSLISSNIQPLAVVNATFVVHVDKNNENLPPSSVNKPKTRKKK